MKQTTETSEFWPAYIKAQKAFGKATWNKKNDFKGYSYTTLDQVLSVVLPPLHANDICLTQSLYNDAGGVVETRLTHKSGQSIWSSWSFTASTDMQKLGSQTTYLRRYQLVALLGIQIGEDDDGEQLTKNDTPSKQYTGKKQSEAKKTKEDGPLTEERIEGMIRAFKALGVDQGTIEDHLGKIADDIDKKDFNELTRAYKLIKNKEKKAEDIFIKVDREGLTEKLNNNGE